MQQFAIYDLDRTITRLPTWSRFLLYAVRTRAPWRVVLIPVVGGAAVLRLLRVIDRDRLKEIMHRLMLGPAVMPAAMEMMAAGFADREAESNIFEDARARLAADRAAGRHLVLATAAHDFYARAIAARLGIQDVIATRAMTDTAGRILSRIDGENCYGAAKHERITAWIEDAAGGREHAHIRFYSDHLTDLPTLQWADEVIVVNPGRPLRTIAAQRRWETVDWTR